MNKKKKPDYSLDVKQDAGQLILSKWYSIQEAVVSLGVSASTLRKWVTSEKGGNKSNNSLPDKQFTLSDHEELLRLRKENIRLKMEREILKKAAAFFAREQG